jgi:hypothetical protein
MLKSLTVGQVTGPGRQTVAEPESLTAERDRTTFVPPAIQVG